MSQIFAFSFIIGILPFSPIDHSLKAVKRSFYHKLTFICTFPVLLLEFYILENIIEQIPAFRQPDGVLSAIMAFGIIPIIIWKLFTLWVWEVIVGKDSSRVLKILRDRLNGENQDLFHEILDFQQQSTSSQLSYPIRWIVISIAFPFLTENLNNFLQDRFIITCVSLIATNLFLFVWTIPIHLHILAEKGYECNSLRNLYHRLFGEFDISKNIGLIGTLLILIIPLIYVWIFKADEFNGDLSFIIT